MPPRSKSVPRLLLFCTGAATVIFMTIAPTWGKPGILGTVIKTATDLFAAVEWTKSPPAVLPSRDIPQAKSQSAIQQGSTITQPTAHAVLRQDSYASALRKTPIETVTQHQNSVEASAFRASSPISPARAEFSAIIPDGAATFIYTAGNGDLSNPLNYTPTGAPGNGQNIIFVSSSGGTVTNTTLSLVNSFVFDTGAGAFTLTGNPLTIDAGVTNNNGSQQTINLNLTLGADQSFDANAGSLTFGGSVNTNGKTLTVTGASTTIFSGVVTGSGSLVKEGSGTAFLTGSYSGNGHTGSTTINAGTLGAGPGSLIQTSGIQINSGGTLLLSGSGRHIGANTDVTLNGGTFGTGGNSEPSGVAAGTAPNYIGALTLTDTSTIDFGAGSSSILEFAGVGTHTSGAILQVINWNGVPVTGGSGDRLLFAGVAFAFIAAYDTFDVSFNGQAGYSIVQYDFLSGNPYYEITALTPVPETSTWITGLLALCAVAFSQRSRLGANSTRPKRTHTSGHFLRPELGATRSAKRESGIALDGIA